MLALIDSYYDYQAWANQRILETARALPFERLTNVQIDGFPPVRDTLVHTMWAQDLWLRRFQGLPAPAAMTPEEFPDLASIERHWQEIDAATMAFRAALTEEQLAASFTYPGLQGGTFSYPLWQAMLHQANHQTYHRGEIAAVLTHLGASPGEMDFFRMFDGRR